MNLWPSERKTQSKNTRKICFFCSENNKIVRLSNMADTFWEKFTRYAKVCGLFFSMCLSDADWLGRRTLITWLQLLILTSCLKTGDGRRYWEGPFHLLSELWGDSPSLFEKCCGFFKVPCIGLAEVARLQSWPKLLGTPRMNSHASRYVLLLTQVPKLPPEKGNLPLSLGRDIKPLTYNPGQLLGHLAIFRNIFNKFFQTPLPPAQCWFWTRWIHSEWACFLSTLLRGGRGTENLGTVLIVTRSATRVNSSLVSQVILARIVV